MSDYPDFISKFIQTKSELNLDKIWIQLFFEDIRIKSGLNLDYIYLDKVHSFFFKISLVHVHGIKMKNNLR